MALAKAGHQVVLCDLAENVGGVRRRCFFLFSLVGKKTKKTVAVRKNFESCDLILIFQHQ